MIPEVIKAVDMISNPVTYMALALAAACYSLYKTIQWVFNRMSGVIEANTTSHTGLMATIESLKDSIKGNSEAVYANKAVLEKCHIRNELRRG